MTTMSQFTESEKQLLGQIYDELRALGGRVLQVEILQKQSQSLNADIKQECTEAAELIKLRALYRARKAYADRHSEEGRAHVYKVLIEASKDLDDFYARSVIKHL